MSRLKRVIFRQGWRTIGSLLASSMASACVLLAGLKPLSALFTAEEPVQNEEVFAGRSDTALVIEAVLGELAPASAAPDPSVASMAATPKTVGAPRERDHFIGRITRAGSFEFVRCSLTGRDAP